jgi:hypothetical protein
MGFAARTARGTCQRTESGSALAGERACHARSHGRAPVEQAGVSAGGRGERPLAFVAAGEAMPEGVPPGSQPRAHSQREGAPAAAVTGGRTGGSARRARSRRSELAKEGERPRGQRMSSDWSSWSLHSRVASEEESGSAYASSSWCAGAQHAVASARVLRRVVGWLAGDAGALRQTISAVE